MVPVKIKPKLQDPEPRQSDTHAYLITGPFGWQISTHTRLWRPSTDVFETEDKVIVRVEIAGMGDSELTVIFDNPILTIQGIRPDNLEKRTFHQMEIHFGQFSSEISIPIPVENDNIEAVYEDGFLWIFLPKAQSKTIHISSRNE